MQIPLSDEQAHAVYNQAIDPSAGDEQGEAWWCAACVEMRQVAAAPDDQAAARVIDWWHEDWWRTGDLALDAARRIRQAAAAIQAKDIQDDSRE